MPPLANTTARKLKYLSHLLWEYSFYLRQELRNPTVYLTSLVDLARENDEQFLQKVMGLIRPSMERAIPV